MFAKMKIKKRQFNREKDKFLIYIYKILFRVYNILHLLYTSLHINLIVYIDHSQDTRKIYHTHIFNYFYKNYNN